MNNGIYCLIRRATLSVEDAAKLRKPFDKTCQSDCEHRDVCSESASRQPTEQSQDHDR